MSDHSAIQWTDATWNPTTGCTKVSPGCANCYIERTPPFRINGRKFVKGHIPVLIHENRFDQPLHWKTPRRVFVNSLSDLFHADVSDDVLHRVYHTMEYARQHQFQILTKRPKRMRMYLDWRYGEGRIPSRHLWHGVSVENVAATWRIDELRETRAAVRFLSIEPLLQNIGHLDLRGIHWVIVGGESGPRSRDCRLAWVYAIVEQCQSAKVPCFVKQLGRQPYVAPDLYLNLHSKKGGDPDEWPLDLRVREFPR